MSCLRRRLTKLQLHRTPTWRVLFSTSMTTSLTTRVINLNKPSRSIQTTISAFTFCLSITSIWVRQRKRCQFLRDYRRTAGKVPAYYLTLLDWGRSLLLLAHWKDAIAKLQEAQAFRASPNVNGYLAIAYAQDGNLALAQSHLAAWRDWYTMNSGAPTIKGLLASSREASNDPNYLKIVDATLLDGYRKLGVPEE